MQCQHIYRILCSKKCFSVKDQTRYLNEKTLTLSYNVDLIGQIFELRHSPSSGKKRNENARKYTIKKKNHRSNEAMKPWMTKEKEDENRGKRERVREIESLAVIEFEINH